MDRDTKITNLKDRLRIIERAIFQAEVDLRIARALDEIVLSGRDPSPESCEVYLEKLNVKRGVIQEMLAELQGEAP